MTKNIIQRLPKPDHVPAANSAAHLAISPNLISTGNQVSTTQHRTDHHAFGSNPAHMIGCDPLDHPPDKPGPVVLLDKMAVIDNLSGYLPLGKGNGFVYLM